MSQLFKISEVIRAAESAAKAAKAAEAAKAADSAVNASKAAKAADSAVNASKAAKASADAFSAASTDDPNAPQRASPLDFRSICIFGSILTITIVVLSIVLHRTHRRVSKTTADRDDS